MNPHPHVVIVGAGAFGGWAALTLVGRGARVTLVDAWGAGHSRASSGGDTRIIRATYGPRRLYTTMAARAMRLWREEDARWRHGCLRPSAAIWMSADDDRFARESATALRDEGLAVEQLTPEEAAGRWPQVDFAGIQSVLVEPDAGILLARRACAAVAARFIDLGGEWRTGSVLPPVPGQGAEVRLADGSRIRADEVVYACGPWLPQLFPAELGRVLTPTRQVVHYFGAPAGDGRFVTPALPVWLELGDRVMYGIPDVEGRGFKIADDSPGRVINPTTDPRIIGDEDIASVRAYLGRRFPALATAPWIGGEVCQYEATPDSDYIIDTHPETERVWLVGGGSGHGFKMGPVIGEVIADAVLGRTGPDPSFSLHRFATSAPSAPKW